MADDHELERLRAAQERREAEEQQARDQASEPVERLTHERRADKASYLREKLDEQAKAPDE